MRQAWRDYRRNAAEWKPPLDPLYKRHDLSVKQKVRKRAGETLKRRLARTRKCKALHDVDAQVGDQRHARPSAPKAVRRGGRRGRGATASQVVLPGAYVTVDYPKGNEVKSTAKPTAAPLPRPTSAPPVTTNQVY